MIDRAAEAGVRVVWNARTTLLDRSTLLVTWQSVKFEWLIGADGKALSFDAGQNLTEFAVSDFASAFDATIRSLHGATMSKCTGAGQARYTSHRWRAIVCVLHSSHGIRISIEPGFSRIIPGSRQRSRAHLFFRGKGERSRLKKAALCGQWIHCTGRRCLRLGGRHHRGRACLVVPASACASRRDWEWRPGAISRPIDPLHACPTQWRG